jgi:two-component system response regulator AtoC
VDVTTSNTHPSSGTERERTRRGPSWVRWVFPTSVASFAVGPTHVVGRDASCDTVLEGTEVSRRHAELRVDGPLLTVHDLDSRNGVFVNGARVGTASLRVGDVVRCGEWIGVALAEDGVGVFREVAPDWFGGPALTRAASPLSRLGDRLSTIDLPIIVQGETGTGKERLAHAIHGSSGRSGPLVAVNCPALPPNLAEAELFGHRKGAFTGADRSGTGLFRAAHGGTIFLDEVLDLPLVIQAKILRVLEQREVLPLGETTPVPIDVRVVTATQEPISTAVAERRFRADLHARLDGITIVIPPLRDRREDIIPLFQELMRRHAGARAPTLDPKAAEALCTYAWPLNVREMVLLVRRFLGIYAGEPVFKRAHLPERFTLPEARDDGGAAPARVDQKRARRPANDDEQFEALVEALRHARGNVAQAAAAMGISRYRAYRLISARPDFSPNGDGT